MSAQSALAKSMREVAKAQMAKIEALIQVAESLEAMEPEQFQATLGSQWSAPGWVAQMVEYVEAATTARPGQTFEFHTALAKALVEAQRQAVSA